MLGHGTSVALVAVRADIAGNGRKSTQFTGLFVCCPHRDRDASRPRREAGLDVSANRHVTCCYQGLT
jgi:hypothetical protein